MSTYELLLISLSYRYLISDLWQASTWGAIRREIIILQLLSYHTLWIYTWTTVTNIRNNNSEGPGSGWFSIIRTIALWGSEVEWRRQEKWRKAPKMLEYKSLRKCSEAPYQIAQAAVDRITGVEPIETKLGAMQARFVVRSIVRKWYSARNLDCLIRQYF